MRVLQSRWLRGFFLFAAVGLAVWAIVSEWDAVVSSLRRVSLAQLGAAAALSFANVALAMLSWRAVLGGLGSDLGVGTASRVYFVGQVGKYLPGGVWNIVAAAELGRDHGVARRRTVSAMLVAALMSVAMAAVLFLVTLPLVPSTPLAGQWWVALLAPLPLLLIVPAVTNALVTLVLRVTRRDALDAELSAGATVSACLWAMASWVAVGLQVWVLAAALGAPPTPEVMLLCIGGYAFAWVVGFVLVVLPAGVGAREAVLALALASVLGRGELLVVVILSRLLMTVADLGTAGSALLVSQRRART
jgi:hypothetical protein